MHDRTDADDVMQDVAVELWRKFDEYDPSRPFTPWACRFASFVARRFVEHEYRRRGRGYLGDEMLAQVARVRSGMREMLEMRQEMLDRCLDRVGDDDRGLLTDFYAARKRVGTLAARLGTTPGAVYARVGRIRKRLVDCVRRRLEAEER